MTDIDNNLIEQLSAWAESGAPFETPGKVLRGPEAAKAGRAALARAGRPNLGNENATGKGRSPRRQVRLNTSTNKRLDEYAKAHGKTASEVIREALDDFLASA